MVSGVYPGQPFFSLSPVLDSVIALARQSRAGNGNMAQCSDIV